MIEACIAEKSHGAPDYFVTRDGVRVYRCPHCATLMADVEFDHDVYEGEGYYSLKFRTREDVDRYWGLRWRHILATIRRFAHPTTLLDVGAGNGYFLCLAREEHGLQATGLEISQREVRFAAEVLGTTVLAEPLDQHNVRDYSVATLFNVLEHVADPAGLLNEAHAHIRPGGHLVVTTPNPSCIHVKLKGLRNWGMIQPPHHINLFARGGLESLLTRAGFRPIHYETLSTYMEKLWKYDTKRQDLRRALFGLLRSTGLGADHFVIAERSL